MALTGEDVLRKEPPDQFTVIEDPKEFQRDLNRRKGGLKTNRKVDLPQINMWSQRIASGDVNPQQAQALIIRNPGAAKIFQSALQTRQRQSDILKQSSPVISPSEPVLGSELGVE